jgi:hypothetical protein
MNTPARNRGLWAGILLVSTLAASAVNVGYYVDMSVQTALGNFTPGNGDTVFVSGNFATTNGVWLQTATDGSTNYILSPTGTNANVYTGTFNITNAPGTFENHQFVINPGGNFLGTLIWEPGIIGGGNRFFTVPSTATNLPVVYFNDVSNVNQQVSANITFYVDMSVQQTLGNFNPSQDFVVVAGDWMGSDWTTAVNYAPSMTATGTNALVYTGTVSVTNTVGLTENYKFVILSQSLGTIWEGDVGPGGAEGNRQFVFPGVATNLPTVFFNNASNGIVPVPVTFSVSLLVENALGVFTPGSDSVDVAGDFNNWSVTANPLTQSADPNVYTNTVIVNGFSVGTTLNYKFTIDGSSTWENDGVGPGGARNHQFVLPSSATNYDMYFNNYTNLGTATITNSAGQAIIKWPIHGSRTRLQSSTNLANGWLDIANTLGASSTTSSITGQKLFRVKGP